MKPWALQNASWLAAALLALASCDGVGRALVAQGGDGSGDDLFCEPMECRETRFAPLRIPEPQSPSASGCAPPAPELCEPATETEPGLASDPKGGCRRTVSLDDDAFDPEALRSLSCGRARLVRTQTGAGTLRIEHATWSRIELDLQTVDPLTLELVSPRLSQLVVHVRGPFTLRVRDTKVVEDVHFASDSAEATVALESAELKTVRFGDDSARFDGALVVTRSKIELANLTARELEFETVGLTDARVTAERVNWVDVNGRRVQLTVGVGIVSATNLTEFEVKSCEWLSLHGAHLAAYAIPACSGGPTRLFSSTLSRGTLDGAFDADRTELNQSVFGVRDATDLLLWDTQLNRVNFCAGTDHVVVAGEGAFLCATCRELDGSQVPIDACVHEDNETAFLKSCGAFGVVRVCDPKPLRMRPPFN